MFREYRMEMWGRIFARIELDSNALDDRHCAQIEIASLRVLKGSLPHAKLAVVVRWAETRGAALQRAWDTVLAKQRPEKIA